MKKMIHIGSLFFFLALVSGCTYHVHSGKILALTEAAPAQCQGTLRFKDATATYTVSATKTFHGATYVMHLGQDLVNQTQDFLPGMHIAQEDIKVQGATLTIDFGPRTSARLGDTIFSGNEVTVELKYTVWGRSENSILSEGTAEGKGSKPTGGIGFIAIVPILSPVVYSTTQSSFEEASQRAMSDAMMALRMQLLKHGVCRSL